MRGGETSLEVDDYLRSPSVLPSLCFLCLLLCANGICLFCLHSFFQGSHLTLSLQSPPWRLPPNVTLQFSHNMTLTAWNETTQMRISMLKVPINPAYLALWEEPLPLPLESTWMWLAEAVHDTMGILLDIDPDTMYVDAFSHRFEYPPGAKVVILPPKNSSLLQPLWGEFLKSMPKLRRGEVVVSQASNHSLPRYRYKVKGSAEDVEYPAGRLRFETRSIVVMQQNLFREAAEEIREGKEVRGELFGGAVAVLGENEVVFLDGYSFSQGTYEFLDYWKLPKFSPKLRRNLTKRTLHSYKPLQMLLDNGCRPAAEMPPGPYNAEEETCSEQMMLCTNETIQSGFEAVKDGALAQLMRALNVYVFGIYVAVPLSTVLFNLVPLTYVCSNLLRHVETELTSVRHILLF